ncbi:MAG: hypothetical protein F4114_10615 [Rhodospirillaceae bacterium]|nr:hypothetical protein [Rhodospirillaceae bacterium]MYB12784.1 hypothetical protein [Rhodospirillaceae bacterium]MYI49524.1 hypothetical protein [Rhodospirillaceae bacterium]
MAELNTRPIRNEAEYNRTLAEIDRLMGAGPGTPEASELDVLVSLVEAYEAAHWPIEEVVAAPLVARDRRP